MSPHLKNKPDMHVCWSHGKESGPWGTKLKTLADQALGLGFDVASLDYRGMDDPDKRAEKLLAHCRSIDLPLILAGSSMGGYVAVKAAASIPVKGLFLLAPALAWPGRDLTDTPVLADHIAIVHGWRDDILPLRHSFRFAESRRAELHLIDGDHRLRENIEELKRSFQAFLMKIRSQHRSGMDFSGDGQ